MAHATPKPNGTREGKRYFLLLRLGILLTAGGLVLLAWQQWQPTSENQQLLSQGEQAEEAARQLLAVVETEDPAEDLLAQIASHLQQAWDSYRRAILQRPLCVDCQYRLARITLLLELLNLSENPTFALEGFQRSLVLAPAWAELWENIGKSFLPLWPLLDDTHRRFALTCLEQTLRLAPERSEAVLAAAFLADPDLPAALSGDDPRRGFTAARLYQQRGEAERARHQAEEVAARLQEAARSVRREGLKDEDTLSSLLLLADVQHFLGNQEAVRTVYEQGAQWAADPQMRKEFSWRLANWYFEHQDYPAAIEYYRSYLALAPDNPEAVRRLGLSLWRTGDREGGVRWLDRAGGMRHGEAGWQLQLAHTFEEMGRYDRANDLYRRLLAQEKQPRPDLLLALARNYKQLGLGQEALAAYRRVLAIETNNAEARAFLALVEGATDRRQ